jgi:hypothetical protein
MASFGWAYINCEDSGSTTTGGKVDGPTGSLQFLTGSNAASGSSNLVYHTAAYGGYLSSTLILTGTLVVTGTISASHFHIEDVAVIDSTGSTYFGNSADDIHTRTGSLWVSGAVRLGSDMEYTHILTGNIDFYSASTVVAALESSPLRGSGSSFQLPGVRINYKQISAISATGSANDYIVGIRAGDADTNYRLPSASLSGTGSLRVIKDEVTARSSTKIYVSSSSPDTIDGQTSYILSGTMSAINLYSDGQNWYIF